MGRPSQVIVKTINECIYCGDKSEDLTNEHIIPNGLAGCWILAKASCKKCAEITSKFELEVLRNFWGSFRYWKNLPTGKPHQRPKGYPIIFRKNGKTIVEKDVPVTDKMSALLFPVFPPPGKLQFGYINAGDIRIIHMHAEVFNFDRAYEVAQKFNADEFNGGLVMMDAFSYPRFIAKIAFCVSVAIFGLHAFKEVFVRPAILGQKNDIGHWVGNDGNITLKPNPRLGHTINAKNFDGTVIGRIRLFSVYNVPVEYMVFVGRI